MSSKSAAKHLGHTGGSSLPIHQLLLYLGCNCLPFPKNSHIQNPTSHPLWEHPTLEGKCRTHLQHRLTSVSMHCTSLRQFPEIPKQNCLSLERACVTCTNRYAGINYHCPLTCFLSSAPLLQSTVSEVCWQTCSSEGSHSLLQQGFHIPPANPHHFSG